MENQLYKIYIKYGFKCNGYLQLQEVKILVSRVIANRKQDNQSNLALKCTGQFHKYFIIVKKFQ